MNTSDSNTTGLSIQAFDFEEWAVRTLLRDDEPWFVAVDVCRVLDIRNSRDAVARLDADEKNTVALTDGNRGNPNTNIITEAGLYTLILRCDDAIKPGTTAHRFRKWITAEVIPAIRKTGRYEATATLTAMTPMQEVRELLLTSARAVLDKTLDVGRAQQIANLSARYLEAIKLEGDAIGYEAVLGLPSGQARGRILPRRASAADGSVQVLPQPPLPSAQAAESYLSSCAVSGQEAVGGAQPATSEAAQPQEPRKGDLQ